MKGAAVAFIAVVLSSDFVAMSSGDGRASFRERKGMKGLTVSFTADVTILKLNMVTLYVSIDFGKAECGRGERIAENEVQNAER